MSLALLSGLTGLASLAVNAGSAFANYKSQQDALEAQEEASAEQNALNRQNLALNRENLEFEKQSYRESMDYNKKLQREIFQREDSAVQRQVADNIAAGLSPIAGIAGSAAGSALQMSPANLSSLGDVAISSPTINPQIDMSGVSGALNNLSALGQSYDNLQLQRDKFADEQSSNAKNRELLDQKIEAQKLSNMFETAVMEDKILGEKYNNQSKIAVINKTVDSIFTQQQQREINKILMAKNKEELNQLIYDNAEIRENKQLRDELGNLSLDEARERVAQITLANELARSQNPLSLQILEEELSQLQRENNSQRSFDNVIEGLGAGADVVRLLLEIFRTFHKDKK